MKHRGIWDALAFVLIFAGSGFAECPKGDVFPFGFEEIDVTSTAKGFTASIAFPDSGSAEMAVCKIEDDAIRYRVDGLNPTATVGMLEPVLGTFTVCGQASLKRFRVIRQTTDADVSCTLYRSGNQ